jgi:hypothetical protein
LLRGEDCLAAGPVDEKIAVFGSSADLQLADLRLHARQVLLVLRHICRQDTTYKSLMENFKVLIAELT